jgi:Trypsin
LALDGHVAVSIQRNWTTVLPVRRSIDHQSTRHYGFPLRPDRCRFVIKFTSIHQKAEQSFVWYLLLIRVAVRLGEHNIVSLEDDAFLQEIAVRRIIPHEKFSLNPLANDVAVLKLEHKVIFNGNFVSIFKRRPLERADLCADRVRPACLPLDDSLDSEFLVGEKVYVAGWGLTQEGDEELSWHSVSVGHVFII